MHSRRIGVLAVVIVLAPLGFRIAHADDFCVGLGQGSTHGSVQAAIDEAQANGPGEDSVYISRELLHNAQQLTIASQNLALVGVFDCELLSPGSRVPINGDNTHSVFTITGSGNETVRMRDLRISSGGADDGYGGGIDQRGGVNLSLEAVTVSGNSSGFGGGIHVENALGGSSGIVYLLPGTVIEQNAAAINGGGIHAQGGRIRMHASDTVVRNNDAGNGGGGVALFNGELSVARYVDSAVNGSATGALIQGNRAGAGGGVLVSGSSAYLFANELIVDGNSATGGAGGILADGGAYVGFQRDYANPQFAFNCAQPTGCNRISNNSVPDNVDGGGIELRGGARAFLYQTVLRGNRARNGSTGKVASGSTLTIEGALIYGNTCVPPVGMGCTHLEIESGTASVRYTTFGTHSPGGNLVAKRQFANLNLFSSLFLTQYAVLVYGANSEYRLDCLIGPFGGGIAPPGPTVTRLSYVADVGVVDAAAGDFRLRSDSPAVDYCDSTLAPANVRDLALASRGNDATAQNQFGPYDMGAFEYYIPVDALFKDGFE
jgi:hypothetical protein